MPKRILIVDDDPDLVEAVSMLLEAAGMEPLAAYGGVEGLEKAKNEDPDLIVLDVMMPDKDGYAVAKELAKDAKLSEIPLIMLTAVVDISVPRTIPTRTAKTWWPTIISRNRWIPKPWCNGSPNWWLKHRLPFA
jgi:CheY-like chemotaxis protein